MTTATPQSDSVSRQPWLLPAALAALGALGWACEEGGGGAGGAGTAGDDGGPGDDRGPGDDTAGDGSVTRRQVLASIANNVLVPMTAEFAVRAETLRVAVAAFAEASDAGADLADTRAAAQTAWREAMTQWQLLEVMQVGPAAPSLSSVAGEGLRDEVYSWPTASSCSVDRATAEQDYSAADFFMTELVWAYGLDGLEYLLFVDDDNHTCPAQIQLDEPWSALGSGEIQARRAAYAMVVADEVHVRAASLATRWASDGGDFAGLLAGPGLGDSPFSDEAEALDDVFRGMFYIDKQAKDGKLGLPLGLLDGCEVVPCVELMESPFGGVSADSLAANLRGLRMMVTGGPDPDTADGFDDLLREMGEGGIADTLLGQIDAAIVSAEAFDGSLQASASADIDAVSGMHAAIKEVTDTLKGPFVMALMLSVPAEGAGDND